MPLLMLLVGRNSIQKASYKGGLIMSEINTNLDFENMSDEELKAFRAKFNVDEMGFENEEGVNDAAD